LLSSGKFTRFAPAIAGLLTALLVFVVVRASVSANSQLVSDLLQTAIAACAAVAPSRGEIEEIQISGESNDSQLSKRCIAIWRLRLPS
jgi:hypothetical protein